MTKLLLDEENPSLPFTGEDEDQRLGFELLVTFSRNRVLEGEGEE